MASDEEKYLGQGQDQGQSTLQTSPASSDKGVIEHLGKPESELALSEEDALAQSRADPEGMLPIYLTFAKDDRDCPRNWAKWRKWYITCFASMLNVVTISSGAMETQKEFHSSAEITTLALSLYVLGFAIGPVLLAPLSEYFGRQPVYVVSWFTLFIFQFPVALAPNICIILVCRSIGGFAGRAPLTNTGGTVSDIWRRNESGGPMAVYGLSSTLGPPLALVMNGYIGLHFGWRWVFWVLMAITGVFWVLLVFTIPETPHTIILQKKTKRVRKAMRKEGLKAADSIIDANADERKSLHQLFAITLTRPFHFLFTEPITFFAAIYNGFLYGLVYLFNEAFPLVFGPGKGQGFNGWEQGLIFIGLCIGPIIAFLFYPLQERYCLRRVAENDGKGVPEARMWMARLGAIFIPASLFWLKSPPPSCFQLYRRDDERMVCLWSLAAKATREGLSIPGMDRVFVDL